MHQLVLHFAADDIADSDAVVEVADLLIDGLQDAEVDGHDFGQGAMNVFILTDDAPRVFAAARTLLADGEGVGRSRQNGSSDYDNAMLRDAS